RTSGYYNTEPQRLTPVMKPGFTSLAVSDLIEFKLMPQACRLRKICPMLIRNKSSIDSEDLGDKLMPSWVQLYAAGRRCIPDPAQYPAGQDDISNPPGGKIHYKSHRKINSASCFLFLFLCLV